MKISNKILKDIKCNREFGKVFDLVEYKEISDSKIELCEGLESIKNCDDYSLIHKIYLTTCNIVSFWAEVLSGLPAFDDYCEIAGVAMEEFYPGASFSPITQSYFGCWAYFDVKLGSQNETMSSCIVDLKQYLRMDNNAEEVIRQFQNSYMGVYRQTGKDSNYVYLEELFTKEEHRCLAASEYMGSIGEFWYARVLPSPLGYSKDSLVFTTPYILAIPSEDAWLEFIERNMFKTKADTKLNSYISFMKQGLDNNYWHRYISSAYSGKHCTTAIFLSGIPDLPETLPTRKR